MLDNRSDVLDLNVSVEVDVDPIAGDGVSGDVKRVDGVPCKTNCAASWIARDCKDRQEVSGSLSCSLCKMHDQRLG